MLYIDVFRDFCMNGLGGGTRLRYVQMRSRRAGTAHRGRRSAAPARARYRAKTEKLAFGTAYMIGSRYGPRSMVSREQLRWECSTPFTLIDGTLDEWLTGTEEANVPNA